MKIGCGTCEFQEKPSCKKCSIRCEGWEPRTDLLIETIQKRAKLGFHSPADIGIAVVRFYHILKERGLLNDNSPDAGSTGGPK